MNWEEALALILQIIRVGTDLNPAIRFRNVVDAPPYNCATYDYANTPGYKVQIGTNQFVEIPLTMLENLFMEAQGNRGVYNKNVFRVHYPDRAEQETGHPCYIHVVGKLFERAGVARQIDRFNYQLL